MAKKKKLNSAPLNVWGEHLNDDENNAMSQRLLELDTKGELTKDELKEQAFLLSMEKGLLEKSKEKVEQIKSTMSAYYKCLDKLKGDERLITMYNVRIADEIERKRGNIETSSEMESIFQKLMEDEMDVDGHKKLKKDFDEIVKQAEEIQKHVDGECDDPDCIYHAPIEQEEYNNAFERLNQEGYFDPSMSDEQKLVTLMTIILRLEDMVNDIDEEDDED